MLIKLTISNFKTFKDKVELSMIASGYDKSREDDNSTLDPEFGLRLLKSAVIYGANASGKSKMMEGLIFMRKLVLTSSKESQKGEPIPVEPFLLQTESSERSSEFEVIFIHQHEMFRYGIEVDREKVVSEWLFHRPKTKEVELFYRQGQQFDFNDRKFTKGASLAKNKMIRENALMVSVAAQFNDKVSGKVVDWFKGFKIISALEPESYKGYSITSLKDQLKKAKILDMINSADLSISDVNLKSLPAEEFFKKHKNEFPSSLIRRVKEDNTQFLSVQTLHQVYNEKQETAGLIPFDLETDESSGTNQFFALTGPIIDVIQNGYVLAVDELDSKLHPNLVLKIVEIFNSSKLNPNNAQLIFNTHDTNLLSADIFRRDQIWFIEKDRYGTSKLYSLNDFKKVRKGSRYEDNYIRGKYGAVPLVSDFESTFKDLKTKN